MEFELVENENEDDWYLLTPIPHGEEPRGHRLPICPGWWCNTGITGVSAEAALEVKMTPEGLTIFGYSENPMLVSELSQKPATITSWSGEKISYPNPWVGPFARTERLPQVSQQLGLKNPENP